MEKPEPDSPSPAVLREQADAVRGVLLMADSMATQAAAIRLSMAAQFVSLAMQAELAEGALAAERAIEAGRIPVRRNTSVQLAQRAVRAELALALGLTESGAERLVETAAGVVELPGMFEAMPDGRLREYTAARIVSELAPVDDPERRNELASRAVALATRAGAPEDTPIPTAATVARKLRNWIGQAAPETLQVRHDRALAERRVWVTPVADGMAEFGALLPAVEAAGMYDRLTRIAKALKDQPGEARKIDQLRADTLLDLVIDGEIPAAPEAARGIRANVIVTVPVTTLCGSDTPAELNGTVPVDPDTARRLAGESTGLTRILTNPETGAVLSVGRDRYRPPEHLRTAIRLRDAKCRFPGCRRPASTADLDHTTAWEHGGTTSAANLAALCRGHHTLKHHSSWQVRHATRGDGTLIWTSPLGHNYRTRPRHPMLTAGPPEDPPPF